MKKIKIFAMENGKKKAEFEGSFDELNRKFADTLMGGSIYDESINDEPNSLPDLLLNLNRASMYFSEMAGIEFVKG